MRDREKIPLREQPISRLFPNMITLAGMCCGLSSIRFAMTERWELAVAFIIAAALIDGMDGRVARMLGASSEFGAQLDSLSDFVCFGVAPAIVMYIWLLHDIKGVGWAITLFYASCAALRLARFNTGLASGPKPAWTKQFFTGVPSPAGGILCLAPLILHFQTEGDYTIPAWAACLYVALVGAAMASRIPTFAGKNMRIAQELILPLMLVASLLIVFFIIEPWFTLLFLCALYLLMMPISISRHRKLSRRGE